MKKMLKIGLLLSLCFLFFGCKKRTFYPMHAAINGVAFNGINSIFEKEPGHANVIIYGGYFSGSTAASVTYPYIGIEFVSLATTGTYEITPYPSDCQAAYLADDSTTKMAVSGAVNITSISDNVISGTFSFTMDDGTKVTDGSFVAKAAQ